MARDIQEVREVMERRMQDPQVGMRQLKEGGLVEDREDRAVMEEVMEEDLGVLREDGVMEEGEEEAEGIQGAEKVVVL